MGNSAAKYKDAPFRTLPNEMKVEIFRHLDLSSKKSARLVCHDWAALIDPMLRLAPDLSDESTSFVARSALCGVSVVSLTTRRLQDPKSVPETASGPAWLDSVTQIVLGEDPVGVSEANLQVLLRHCAPQLKRLEFEEASLKNVTASMNFGQFGNLTHLGINFKTYRSYDPAHHGAIVSLLARHSFAKLSALRISFCDSDYAYAHPVGPYTSILTSAYLFIGRHHQSLRTLRLNEAPRICWSPPQQEQLADDRLPLSTSQELRQLNLSHLRLRIGHSGSSLEQPALYLASNHSHLVTLDLWGSPIPPEFQFTIMNNVRTLRRLRWCSVMVRTRWPIPGMPPNSFDVSILTQATSLLHLTVSATVITNLTFLPVQIQRLFWASNLSADQLVWIAWNLKCLRSLVVREEEDSASTSSNRSRIYARNQTEVPFITLGVLKHVLASADSLELWEFWGQYEEETIGAFCGVTAGLQVSKVVRGAGGPGFRLEIDQEVLDKSKLE